MLTLFKIQKSIPILHCKGFYFISMDVVNYIYHRRPFFSNRDLCASYFKDCEKPFSSAIYFYILHNES
jgi:hypothetical protein